jgi:glycosyltransferase involved in cell wall biosynthesis
MERVLFLVPGGLDRVTGGNLYDRYVIDRLRDGGMTVEVREPRDLDPSSECIVVDSLAFRFGRPQISIPYVALVHQLPSAVAGFPEPTVQERDVLRFAHLVVTVSDWLVGHVRRFTSAPVVAIPPGRDRAWAAEGPDADADGLLCVANAHPGKGVAEVIDAFGRVASPGRRLVLAGDLDVDPEESRRVHNALDRCDGEVEVAGVIDPDALSARYARAAVFVTGTRYEGRPIAVGEAMASGVPVVGFDVPGLRELVRPGRDGVLAEAGNVPDLAASLDDLLSSPDLGAAMGRAARHRALSWPTWAETSERFAETLGSIGGRRQETVPR